MCWRGEDCNDHAIQTATHAIKIEPRINSLVGPDVAPGRSSFRSCTAFSSPEEAGGEADGSGDASQPSVREERSSMSSGCSTRVEYPR